MLATGGWVLCGSLMVTSNSPPALPYGPAAVLVETIHEEAFRKEQMCDARQALAMAPMEAAIKAVLEYEKAVAPILSGAQEYFTHRPSPAAAH